MNTKKSRQKVVQFFSILRVPPCLFVGSLLLLIATPRASAQNEMMQSKSAMAGNSVESYRLVNKPDEIVAVLRNGLTVIVKRIASPVVAVRGVCATGGVYEGKWLGGGLSHLLEHLVAGGSCERRTEAENRNLLQQIGNDSYAYTTEDHTAFFVNTTTPHMEQAVDLVTGWMFGAKITREEYRREYEVVQRELEMGKGEPDRQFYYMSAKNRYRVSPARVPVIGYQEVIQGLSRDDVYNYYKMAYVPQNITFCVVGDIDPEAMLLAVRKNVGDVVPGRVFSHDIAAEPPVLTPRSLVASFPKLGQARLELAFPSVKLTSPDLYALDVLAGVLGSGDSSLLVEELRDEKQLVSGITAEDETPTYADGSFSVDLQLDPEKIPAATVAVLDRLDAMKTALVDADRLNRAKMQMKISRVKSMLTGEDIASSLCDDFMSTGDDNFQDVYVDRIQKVTAEQVRDAAKKYFDRGKLITTTLLPAESAAATGVPGVDQLLHGPTTKPATQASLASAVQKIELPNHVTLLLKRITNSPMVSIDMYAAGGLTAEDAKTNGLGNLTMDMLQRGTTTRSAQQIAELFDTVGGDLDTACGNNTWHWSTSCLKEDFDKTLNAYADVVTHPAFADSELAPMKQRIDAAIDGQDADWTAQAFRYFKSVYFGPTESPYRLPVTGSKANVDRFTASDVRQWYEDHVLRGERVLAIYGDIDPDHARQLVEQLLGRGTAAGVRFPDLVLKSAGPAATQPASTPSIDVLDVKVQQTQQALAGVVIGFQADAFVTDPMNPVLDVDQTLAGGWRYPTGYLFETLRGQGLVYVAEAMNNPGVPKGGPGAFVVFAGCGPDKVTTVVEQSLLNIARLQGTPADVQTDWFKRTKQLITTGDAMENQTPEQQGQTAALDELFGLGYDYHAGFAGRINAVTMDQARQTAAARLRQCVVTICTPDPSAVHVKTGMRTYASFPPVDLTPRGVQHGPTFGK